MENLTKCDLGRRCFEIYARKHGYHPDNKYMYLLFLAGKLNFPKHPGLLVRPKAMCRKGDNPSDWSKRLASKLEKRYPYDRIDLFDEGELS